MAKKKKREGYRPENRPTGNKTKPHLRQKHKIVKVNEEPGLNKTGLWQKPDHNDIKKQYIKRMKTLAR